ncbi:hypothetical protein [Paenibacillus aquistagni]|uniref:Uncharacterized protein n=1 Tax=Paenibacillus aquistagni TaxID=1852522 RepID=A0A1X7JLY7_9BACL|nr:hypothetical protein [Paenibacillus aquistagni]SMG29250.1 hypothetical protein SAMN06295960_1746 [Paenibacillus aquistagni]
MKKKIIMSLLSVFMMICFAVPVFAEVSSSTFNLTKAGSSGGNSYNVGRYLDVDSKGTVEFSIHGTNVARGWNIQVSLINGSTGKSAGKVTLTDTKTSGKFTNLLASDSYIIAVKNLDSSSRSGTFNYSWTGKWGGFIN